MLKSIDSWMKHPHAEACRAALDRGRGRMTALWRSPEHRNTALAVAVGMTLLAVISYFLTPEGKPKPVLITPTAGPAPREEAEPITPQEAAKLTRWAAIEGRLNRFDRESDEALEAKIAEFNAFMDEKRFGALGCAQELLSWAAKGQYFWGMARWGGEKVNDALEWISINPWSTTERVDPTGDLRQFTVDKFINYVVSEEELSAKILAIFDAFVAELKARETQLLVDLQADLADDAIAVGFDVIEPKSVLKGWLHLDDLIAEMPGTTLVDTGVAGAKVGTSFVVGNLVVDRLTNGGNTTMQKIGTGMLANGPVDVVIDQAVGTTGYDPEKKLTDIIKRTVDAMRDLIVNGDPDKAKAFSQRFMLAHAHPDQDVVQACQEAASCLERCTNVGLRQRLTAIHLRRSFSRAAALFQHVHGRPAPLGPHYEIKMELLPPPADLIRSAKEILVNFGGEKP